MLAKSLFFEVSVYVKWASLVAQLIKNLPAMQETPVRFLGQEDPLRRDRLPTQVFLGCPGGSADKESTCNAGDLGSVPQFGRSPGEGNGYPLQYSGLENSMDSIVHGVTKSWTQLNGFHFHFQSQALHFNASNAKSYLTLMILVAPCGILHTSLQQKA